MLEADESLDLADELHEPFVSLAATSAVRIRSASRAYCSSIISNKGSMHNWLPISWAMRAAERPSAAQRSTATSRSVSAMFGDREVVGFEGADQGTKDNSSLPRLL